MSVIGSNILAGASGQGGYFLTNSLRFRSSASAYLNRTGGTSTSRRIHTFSFWTKYSVTGGTKVIASAGSDDNNREWLGFSDNNFYYQVKDSGNFYELGTSQVLRDPSAWYHLMVAVDTTQATSSNRVKMYINGVQVTAFGTSTYPPQNDDLFFNDSNGGVSYICALRGFLGTFNYDGYLAEFNFIDGQQLTPSSFGQTSATTGVWIPKKYTGTYGTNGFYLPFTDTSSTSTLGNDFSGNSNTWTVNNISLTAGSTYDSMTDVPTLTSATAANYCVWNAVDNANGEVTLKNANLEATRTSSSADWAAARATIFVSSGKWYFEMQSGMPDAGFYTMGVSNASFDTTGYTMSSSNSWACYLYDGNKANGSGSSYGTGATSTSDVFQCAVDMDSGKIWWGKNGTFFASGDPAAGTNAAFTNLSGQSVAPTAGVYGSSSSNGAIINFGQRPFAYTPPTGFVRLNTFNLPTPTIGATASTTANKYMDATLYTGTGSTQSIVNSGAMQPDLVWLKSRSNAQDHNLYDSVRGISGTGSPALFSNLTDAETTYTGFGVSALNSNGFTVIGNGGLSNSNGFTYVGWQWRASNATAVTNTNGSITSTVSANTTAGFSIVTYTGNGSNATIGHGLGVAPSMIIRKARNASAQNNWYVYHSSLSANGTVFLNLTDAYFASANYWNNTAPTSSVFTVGSATNVLNDTWVAYCFAQVAGYSAFGSYTGNGSSDGTFVYTNFAPSFVMVKRTDTTGNWFIIDNKRLGYNGGTKNLYPNLSNAEATLELDLISNGFKWRLSGADVNASGGTYIYMAFAETPLKFSNAR